MRCFPTINTQCSGVGATEVDGNSTRYTIHAKYVKRGVKIDIVPIPQGQPQRVYIKDALIEIFVTDFVILESIINTL